MEEIIIKTKSGIQQVLSSDAKTKSGIQQVLIPDAKEDLLSAILQRLRSSNYALMRTLDFPERLCTERWTQRIEILSKGTMEEGHALFKPLVSLLTEMRELFGKWTGPKHEREDLQEVIDHYSQFIKEVCNSKGKNRIERIVGPVRLYGWKKCWQISQAKGRSLAGIDTYNQSLITTRKGRREILVGEEDKVLLKLLQGRNPMQVDRENAVESLATLLFGDCLPDKELIKLSDLWVADPYTDISRGTSARQLLAKRMSKQKKSVADIFAKYPMSRNNYPLSEERVESTAMACEILSIQDLKHHLQIGYCTKPIDSKSLSIQVCLSLVLRPSRDRLSNLLISDGKVTAKEYLESLLPPVSMKRKEPILNLRSMLLMSYADQPLHKHVHSHLAKINPEKIILLWLDAIVQRNRVYKRQTELGIFSENDYQELDLPIKMPYEYVALTYSALKRIKKACEGQKEITLGLLFKAVHPEVAALYEKFSQESGNYEEREKMLFPEKGICFLEDILSKSDPIYQGLRKIAAPTANKKDNKTPLELAEQWLGEVELEKFKDEQCCAIVTNALKLMPGWRYLHLRHCPLSYDDLVNTLSQCPQIRTLSLERFSERLTKSALLNLGTTFSEVDISIGECPHISAVDLRDLARSKGKFSILLGANTYLLGDVDPNQLLRAALEVGATTVAEYCILEKATLHNHYKHNQTLLHQAAKHWPLKSLKFLVENTDDLDPRDYHGNTPFLQACKRGNVQVIDLLKTNKAHLQAADTEGLTGLHHAVIAGHLDATKLLLDWSVGLDKLSNKGFNPLHLAVLQHKTDIVKLFAEHGEEQILKQCNQGDVEKGATPLHLALRGSEHPEIVQLLVDLNCDVNICDNESSTPLHWAAEHGHTKSFKILLEAEASLCTTDANQLTALDLGLQKHNYSLLGEVIAFDKLDEDHDAAIVHLSQQLLNKQKAGTTTAGELFVLGLCHELGKGSVDKNMKTAHKCYKDADQMGSPLAQYHLAKLFEKQGEPQKAFDLFERAATQGHAEAQYQVGLYLWKGKGHDHPIEPEAIEWFEKAAKNGHPEANFQMYNIYRTGRSVKADPWKAKEYLQAAADAGHEKAGEIIEFEQRDI